MLCPLSLSLFLFPSSPVYGGDFLISLSASSLVAHPPPSVPPNYPAGPPQIFISDLAADFFAREKMGARSSSLPLSLSLS